MNLRLPLCSALVLFGPALASAEPTPSPSGTEVYPFPEVVVQAARPQTTVGGAGVIEAAVDSLAIPPAATVEEVLDALPLVHVRRNSRGEAEISARGSESRQVAILVDGVPITLAWDARADVSVIPATALESVTFTRGLASMLHGPNVLGGVIEARIGQSRIDQSAASAQVTMGADDAGAFGTTVSGALPARTDSAAWLFRGGVGFRKSDGDPLAKGIEEPIDTGNDLRLNTDFENLNGFVSARYEAQAGPWASLSASRFTEERGMAAQLGVADEDARLWRYPFIGRTLAVLSAGTGFHASPLGGRGDVEASIGFDQGRTEIDAYTSRAYDELDTFENGRDQTMTVRLLADQSVGARGSLRGALTLSDIRHDEVIPDGRFEYQQRLWSAGLEHVHRLVEAHGALNALNLSVGGAYDLGQTPKAGGRETLGDLSEWGGRVGVSALMHEGRMTLHAGLSRRARFPALRELYSGALNRFAPNPDLEPEKLVTIEAGATRRIGQSQLQAVFFHNQMRDAVVRITLEDRRFMRVNRNELTSTGLELVGSSQIGPLGLTASGMVQSVDLTNTNADETARPENLPEVSGDLSIRFPVARKATGSVSLEYTGDQFAIDPATGDDAKLSAEAVVGAALAREWRLGSGWGGRTFRTLEARLACDNLGDVARYDAAGLPDPGRRLRFELRIR